MRAAGAFPFPQVSNWRQWPTRILQAASQQAEVAAAALVLLIVLMMILPLPTLLVDILIAFNIGVALLLVSLSLYLPGPQAFTSFPSVLLLTTLFRLGIEISTSRLILLHGDAGEIVETFGRFVVGGNLVVGLIVFLIIAIVQFLVVTKGAERVAEVSARFTLDAIPGKQMAIDSDLRAGLILPQQAQKMRAQLSKDSQMHGAMDGAMKFVKGDAIAGLIIVAVNLVGGIAVGVAMRGMSVSDALAHYAVLTIGDGLVAQIPALLISITAGMLITRSSGEEGESSTVGKEIAAQMLSQPQAWLVTGAACVVFAVLPGMPWVVLLLLGIGFASVGGRKLWVTRRMALEQQARNSWEARDDGVAPDDRDLREFRSVRHIVLAFSPASLALPEVDEWVRTARRVRNRLVLHYGLTVPNIEIERDPSLPDDHYTISVQDVLALRARLRVGQICRMLPVPDDAVQEMEESAEIDQVSTEEGEADDALYRERGARWVAVQSTEQLDVDSYCTPANYFSIQFERLLFRHAPRFVGLREVRAILSWLEQDNPVAAKEINQMMTAPRFAEVVRSLLEERVSVRNMTQIVETLVLWAPKEKDIPTLVEYVRIALGSQICQEFSRDDTLYALLLDNALEEKMRGALRQSAQGYFLALDQESTLSVVQQIKSHLANMAVSHPDPVLLVTQDLRRFVRRLLQDELPHIHVLSFSELDNRCHVQPVATIVDKEYAGEIVQ